MGDASHSDFSYSNGNEDQISDDVKIQRSELYKFLENQNQFLKESLVREIESIFQNKLEDLESKLEDLELQQKQHQRSLSYIEDISGDLFDSKRQILKAKRKTESGTPNFNSLMRPVGSSIMEDWEDWIPKHPNFT